MTDQPYRAASSFPVFIRRRGFTLVELLVVIGIIALLIGILMPALNRAREMANRTACLSNVRTIGQGLMIYTNENKGMLPPFINTVFNYGDPNATPPLVLGVPNGAPSFLTASMVTGRTLNSFYCPSSDGTPMGTFFGVDYGPTPLSDTTYVANGVVFGRSVGTIPKSSEVVMVHEIFARTNTAAYRPLPIPPDGNYNVFTYKQGHNWRVIQWHVLDNGKEQFDNRHDSGGNLVFVDGHGEYRKYKEFRTRDFGMTPDEPWSPTNSDTSDTGGVFTTSF